MIEMIYQMASDRLWIYTAIVGALFGAAFLAYFRSTHAGIYLYMKFDEYLDKRVVLDGKVITRQSPGTAMEFALKLVEILFGIERMKKVNAGVLARI